MISSETIKRIVIDAEWFTAIGADCGLDDELNLDSMSLIWLINELEQTFEVEIDYRHLDLKRFNTIQAIRDHVVALLEKRTP